jgi:hypothetical protein
MVVQVRECLLIPLYDLGRVVGRCPVNDHDLDIIRRLSNDAIECRTDEGAEIVDRDADGKTYILHEYIGVTLK